MALARKIKINRSSCQGGMRLTALSFATLMSYSPDSIRDALATCGALRVANCPSEESAQNLVEHMHWISSRLDRDDSLPYAATTLRYEAGNMRKRPSYKLFLCTQPAPDSDEIVLVDGRVVAALSNQISKSVTRRLCMGVTYERTLPFEDDPSSLIGTSWRNTFQCNTTADVETALQRSELQWAWRPNASLWVRSQTMPAFAMMGNERIFSNSILSVSRTWNDARNCGVDCVRFSDGESIPVDFVAELYEAAWKTRYECRMQAMELLVVDNSRTMHAYKSFKDDQGVLTALVS